MNIIFFEKLDSTNTYAKENIDHLKDKDIILATFQSAGRGRFTRTWSDIGPENIYMTIVLKPFGKNDASEMKEVYSNLTQYLSVCLCKVLEEFGLSPQIKWPNDILINNKKISGILAESVMKKGKLKGIALGIGINLNTKKEFLEKIDRPATSVNIELEREIDKKEFTQKLLNEFFFGYEDFLEKGFPSIKNYYEKNTLYNNKEISVLIFDRKEKGKIVGFSDSGGLLLEKSNSEIININMGEIV